METYLTIEGLAEYLKLTVQTIRRWVLNREVPYHKVRKVVRFRVSEIEKWIDNGGRVAALVGSPATDEGEGFEGELFADDVPPEDLPQETDSGETAETE